MSVVFCITDYRQANLPLQPWLTVHRVASELRKRGYDVAVLTDTGDLRDSHEVPVHVVSSLSAKGSRDVVQMLDRLKATCVVPLVSPFSLATASWYCARPTAKKYAFLSYALYEGQELKRAFRYVRFRDLITYARNVILPDRWWVGRLQRCFSGVVCQSQRTAERLGQRSANRISTETIPPGIDKDLWGNGEKQCDVARSQFLYVGSPREIRGITVLLDAMPLLGNNLKLVILARGADDAAVHGLESLIRARGVGDRVEIVAGWMEREKFHTAIARSTAVVLPFALVPSELPVSVMEIISCGTPVIVSDIDGLPGAAGGAGLVVSPCDPADLARAMSLLVENDQVRKRLGAACQEVANSYMEWVVIADRWEALLCA